MLSLFVLANDKPTRVDSCPGEATKAAVRCCEMDGAECHAPDTCHTTSFEEAEEICYNEGMRLCSPSEMKGGKCCKVTADGGCGFDNKLTWQGKYNELQSNLTLRTFLITANLVLKVKLFLS